VLHFSRGFHKAGIVMKLSNKTFTEDAVLEVFENLE